jgi:hypothetical protein
MVTTSHSVMSGAPAQSATFSVLVSGSIVGLP